MSLFAVNLLNSVKPYIFGFEKLPMAYGNKNQNLPCNIENSF